MKNLITISICLVSCLLADAQSLFNNHLYTNNLFSVNPSFAGSREDLSVSFQSALYPSTRYGSPEFISVFAEAAFFDNLAAGVSFNKEVFGSLEQTIGNAALAYRVGFSNESKLSFGMSLGFYNARIQTEKLNLTPYVDRTDPVLNLDDISQNDLTMGFGMHYTLGGFTVGASLPNMLKGQDLSWQESNLMAAYAYVPAGSVWEVRPVVSYFTRVEEENVFDGTLQVLWKDKLWAQGGTRSNGSNHAGMGINLPNIKLGYAFGWAAGDVSQFLSGKHELMVTFALNRNHKVKLGKNRLAEENNEEESYQSMMKKFDHMIRRYEQLSDDVVKKSQESETKEQELEKLSEEIKVLKGQLEDEDHTVVVQDELLSDKIQIKKGYYIIVGTCRRLICAEDVIKDFADKGVNASLVLNRNKGLYYITSGFYANYQEALENMMQRRESGIEDAWVLVNDFEQE